MKKLRNLKIGEFENWQPLLQSFRHSLYSSTRAGIIALFLLLIANIANSQETFNSGEVETRSYQLYVEKKWNALIHYGNKALDNKVDYFYLRMRIGIAYYEKQDYRAAQRHFWKALAFNSADDAAMEYLYYAYIFTAQFDEAKKLTKKFSKELAEKLKVAEQSSVNFLFAEGGTKQSSNANLFSPPRYLQFGLGHQMGKSMSVTHSFTNYMQPLQAQTNQPPGIFNQNQYYLKSNFALGKSWLFSPSVHFISRKFTPNKPPPYMQQPPRPPKDTINRYRIFSASLKKSFALFDVKASSSFYREQNRSPILQQNLSLAYFPFANNKFSLAANGYLISDKNDGNNFYAKSFTASVRPLPKAQITLNYLLNQSINLNEENGYIVNNSYDLTSSRISGLVDFSLSKNVSLYLLLMKENKITANTNANYYYNTIIAGLKIVP